MTGNDARKLALVTGASAGIGAAFARTLAAQGYDLALVARRADRLAALAAELEAAHGISAQAIAADLALPDCHAAILPALGGRRVDFLVNNAGLTVPGAFVDSPWPRQRDALMVLVTAVADLTHAVLPGMIAARAGRIVTISSMVAASQGGPGNTLYPGAKAFAHLFTLSLDAEVRRHGVICTSVLPGSTSSEFRAANGLPVDLGGFFDRFASTPDDVVRVALAANAAGKCVAIPGWHNKLAVTAMKLLPGSTVRWIGRRVGSD